MRCLRSSVAPLGAVLAFALSAPSQRLILAMNDDDTHSGAIGWPSSTVAMRFDAPSTTSLAAAQIFTGNAAGTNRLALWSHDTANDRPGAPLQPATSWSMLRQRCFQGVEFVPPIPIAQGTTYWLVWDVVNFAANSTAGSTATPNVDVRVSSNGGASWTTPSVMWAAQFRLYEPSPTGQITAYGTAKPGVNGIPTIGISGWPTVGNPLDVWVDDCARRTDALLVVGWPTQIVTPLGTIWVDPQLVVFTQTGFLNFPGVTLIGSHSLVFRVPNVPAAIGFPLSFQWAIVDQAAAGGISHTAAVTAVLQ